MQTQHQSKVAMLQQGGVGVLATDTLYGLVGLALNRVAVERIYQIKRRRPDKPMIILISDYKDLTHFGVKIDSDLKAKLKAYWPGPVSVVFPCHRTNLKYLHRGTNSLAFRIPAKSSLRALLKSTGPLIAPSANPEGEPPAKNIKEARNYFGEAVDFYQRGRTTTKASKLIKVTGDKIEVLRP